MKISAEAQQANQQLINELQTKWKEQERTVEDRAYFKFKSLSAGIFADMDLIERELLDVIAQTTSIEPLTVSEAMELKHIASPATLHRKIDSLRKAGWVEHAYVGDNRRTKLLVTTRAAKEQYEALGKAIRGVFAA